MTSAFVCSEGVNKRPTSGLISFYPKDIVDTRHFIRLTAHEIAHALGFELNRMKDLQMIMQRTVNGVNVPEVRSETVVAKVKEHFGCDNATGIYMESEHLQFSSHLERRLAKDDLMSTYSEEPSGMYYTSLTLAIFNDMKFYKANFSMAETMSWGSNAGCEFLTEKCIQENIIKYPNTFCTESRVSLQCTSDRLSLGRCTSSNFPQDYPEDYRNFKNNTFTYLYGELTDGCPIIRQLEKTTCQSGDLELMPGSILGKGSRCLQGDGLIQKKSAQTFLPVGDICANVKCEDGKVKVQYKGNDKWHECPDGGKIENLEGTEFQSGSILCPKYAEVCTDLPQISELRIESNEAADIEILQDYVIGRDLHDISGEESKVANNSTSDHTVVENITCTVGNCDQHTAGEGADKSIVSSYFGVVLFLLFIAAVMV
ncbi:putative surface protease GP63 [Trypanosoma theileri]|uniref:Leishmanolysin-like peptidase n=1 Tax=Trypanosoma theileri TaxID=67003 RepID=A0A1X0NJC6_9TRYP|nr:putative surface protease GP63 [Trypanosoma theileri]ORC84289.1 putative surface protease GP63 [Trypanosoma theileri]